jgi:hypothetical protein
MPDSDAATADAEEVRAGMTTFPAILANKAYGAEDTFI